MARIAPSIDITIESLIFLGVDILFKNIIPPFARKNMKTLHSLLCQFLREKRDPKLPVLRLKREKSPDDQ
jgi:hypothetical protein